MGDNYLAGQVGAMGPNAQASNMTFQQIWNQAHEKIDLQQLEKDISVLRTALRSEATQVEHEIAIGAVAEAELAAKEGNGPKVLEKLKIAGSWAFDIATKIGVDVAKEALKHAMIS